MAAAAAALGNCADDEEAAPFYTGFSLGAITISGSSTSSSTSWQKETFDG
jgi:hypothetical protein